VTLLLLLRHATAGHRAPGADDDHLRPLDEQGRRQAAAYPALFAGYGIRRVLTSPYVRCRQSVEPLASAAGLAVEEREELAEGVARAEPWSLVTELGGETAVLCSHGDVLDLLLGEEPPKGSTWVVDADPSGGSLRRRRFLPPPA
jgi:8-oxo-dGTP diphosphatase